MANIHALVTQACKTNDLQILKDIKFEPRTLMAKDQEGRIPLLIAAAFGNIAVIKFLDDKADELLGYEVYKIFSERDAQGYNALSLAAKNQHTTAVVVLYELGAYDIFTANEQDWETYAHLQIEPREDNENVARTLQQDAWRRLADIYNKRLYNEVTYAHTKKESIRNAVNKVGDINTLIYDEHSALYHAVRYRNVTAIKELLELGARIDPEMIPIALDSKDEEIISLLGEYIPLSIRPLHWGSLLDILLDHAIRKNNAKMAQRLIPNMTKTKLEEALIYSAELGSDDLVQTLLKHGVDVNCREDSHRARTPAMLAAKNGNLSTLQILLAHGANLRLRSERGLFTGLTALDYAKIYQRKNCVKLLREEQALQKFGDNPVNRAAAHGSMIELDYAHPDKESLKAAIRVAKESHQSAAFVKELRAYMRSHYPREKIVPLATFFKRKSDEQ